MTQRTRPFFARPIQLDHQVPESALMNDESEKEQNWRGAQKYFA
jgi:hypothetical protein